MNKSQQVRFESLYAKHVSNEWCQESSSLRRRVIASLMASLASQSPQSTTTAISAKP